VIKCGKLSRSPDEPGLCPHPHRPTSPNNIPRRTRANLVDDHRFEPLAVSPKYTVAEGELDATDPVLRFPDQAEVEAWWHSERYQGTRASIPKIDPRLLENFYADPTMRQVHWVISCALAYHRPQLHSSV